MKRITTWLLAGLSLSLVACGRPEAKQAGAESSSRPAAPVSVAAARLAGESRATEPGVVRARHRAALSARFQASLVELPLREGERVAAGGLLARLDDEALRSALSAAESAAKAAEADRVRYETLASRGAATTREREAADARAASARSAVSAARDALSYSELRSPFAGVVAERPARLGAVVGPGETVVVVEGLDGYEVVSSVSAARAERLRPGSRLPVEIDGVAGSLEATVTAVSPGSDPATHRVELRADLPKAEGVRSGLFARLLLPADPISGEESGQLGMAASEAASVIVPRSAVFERGGLNGLFVVEEDRVHLRWVAPGRIRGEEMEVRAGLKAGERVVLSPAGLSDGDRVALSGGTR